MSRPNDPIIGKYKPVSLIYMLSRYKRLKNQRQTLVIFFDIGQPPVQHRRNFGTASPVFGHTLSPDNPH